MEKGIKETLGFAEVILEAVKSKGIYGEVKAITHPVIDLHGEPFYDDFEVMFVTQGGSIPMELMTPIIYGDLPRVITAKKGWLVFIEDKEIKK